MFCFIISIDLLKKWLFLFFFFAVYKEGHTDVLMTSLLPEVRTTMLRIAVAIGDQAWVHRIVALPKTFSSPYLSLSSPSFPPNSFDSALMRTQGLEQCLQILYDNYDDLLKDLNAPENLSRGEFLLLYLASNGWTVSDIDRMPLGVNIAIREALETCREEIAGKKWTLDMCSLVGKLPFSFLLSILITHN